MNNYISDYLSLISLFYTTGIALLVFINRKILWDSFLNLSVYSSHDSKRICYEDNEHRHFGLELLRIVSMLMIISFHYLFHGGIIRQFYGFNSMLASFMRPFDVGVNCYILISGYFLVASAKFSWFKLLKLWKVVVFYSVSFFLLDVFYIHNTEFIKINFIKAIFPLRYSSYWFATVYMGMYLLVPYIARFAKLLTHKEYLKLLTILLGAFSLFSFYTPKIDPFGLNGGFNNVFWFIIVFLIGGYLRLFSVQISKRQAMISYILFSLSTGFLQFFIWKELNFELVQYEYESLWFLNNLLTFLLGGVSLFLLFQKIVIESYFAKKLIELFSPLCFGIYLIHDNPTFREYLWKTLCSTESYYYSPFFLLHWIMSVMIVFFASAIIEYIRLKTFKLISNYKKA